jgi:NADPH2:quinone reductase
MRRIVYTAPGSSDVLDLIEEDIPEPGPGDVRVRIHRSGVNPTDWKSRSGATGQTPGARQTPNQDGAGVVDAVGIGVDSALLGLRVWVFEAAHQRPYGTAADYAVVPSRHVVPLPDVASFDLGAGLGVPFVTAHRCLTVAEQGPRQLGPGTLQGRTVLVAGGAGAVGNAAIQLSRWSDATVITTVSSPRKAQLASAAGADHVIDYTTRDVRTEVRKIATRGVDLIIEVAAAQNMAVDAAVLAHHGSVAIYADNGGSEATLPIRRLMVVNARLQFVLLYTVDWGAKERAVIDIGAAVLDRAARVGEEVGLPLQHFTLEQTAAAHDAVENGAVGKVIIDVAD